MNKITSSRFGLFFIASLLGAIQVFSFAPFQQWWVLYPSFVGLLLLLKHVKQQQGKLFLISFAFNLSMFVATIHWIYVSMDLFGGMPLIVSALLIVLLCAYLAIFPSVALWLTFKATGYSMAVRLLLILPSLWLIMDFLRGWVLTGFPWAYLGYSHIDTPFIGYAPVFGVQGVTLAIILTCAALTLFVLKQHRSVVLSLILFLTVSGFALKKITYTQLQPAVKVALVQGNIDQNKKWEPQHLGPSLRKYLQLSGIENTPNTEVKEVHHNELIIWPESAIAALEVNMQSFLQSLSTALQSNQQSLLTGIIGYNLESKEYFNTIVMLGDLPEGQGYSNVSTNRYQKHHLLPIGEFVPFEELLRPLAPYFNLPMSSFHRGAEVQANLQANGTTLAAALCYEIAFPELLRKNIHADTGMILTISNDAWFGDSIGPDQHLQIARMRAIEFARPVLRSTNTGITAIYDSMGHEVGRLPPFEAGVLRKAVQPAQGETPYQKWGQTPLFIFCLLTLVAAWGIRRRQHQASKEPNTNHSK